MCWLIINQATFTLHTLWYMYIKFHATCRIMKKEQGTLYKYKSYHRLSIENDLMNNK